MHAQGYGDTMEKVNLVGLTRPYELPPDPRITADQAGLAAAAMLGSHRTSSEFPERAGPRVEGPWNIALPDSLFSGVRMTPALAQRFPGPGIIDSLARPLTPAERAWLEQVSTAPAWRDFDLVARAPVVDYLGGRFVIPFPARSSVDALPIPSYMGTKAYGYANAARIGWYLARGRRDSAEIVARAGLAFGFHLMDDGNSQIETIIGAVLVGTARDYLVRLYRVTKNPAAARILFQRDSFLAAREQAAPVVAASIDFNDPAAVRRGLIEAAHDTSLVRGLRVSLLYTLGAAPCTNAQELVFGPAPDIRAAFADAHRSLARFPSEHSMLDLMETGTERSIGDTGIKASIGLRAVWTVADVTGFLLHNRRIPTCVRGLMLAGM